MLFFIHENLLNQNCRSRRDKLEAMLYEVTATANLSVVLTDGLSFRFLFLLRNARLFFNQNAGFAKTRLRTTVRNLTYCVDAAWQAPMVVGSAPPPITRITYVL